MKQWGNKTKSHTAVLVSVSCQTEKPGVSTDTKYDVWPFFKRGPMLNYHRVGQFVLLYSGKLGMQVGKVQCQVGQHNGCLESMQSTIMNIQSASIYTSIHPSIIPSNYTALQVGTELVLSQLSERDCEQMTGSQKEENNHPHSHLQPIQSCQYLNCRRKPGYLQGTHSATGRTQGGLSSECQRANQTLLTPSLFVGGASLRIWLDCAHQTIAGGRRW